jgi:hypothetical protein
LLESPTDTVAMTTLNAHHQPHSLVAGHTLSAAEADQLNSSADYEMPAPGSFERSKLGFCSHAGEF